jgi:hypothetical protein
MYKVSKVCPMYGSNAPDEVDVIALRHTYDEAVEALRSYYLARNMLIITLPNAPKCIVELARRNVTHNPDIKITTDYEGVVFVDGRGPEMDYFTIREIE